jgi:hypothetical protein
LAVSETYSLIGSELVYVIRSPVQQKSTDHIDILLTFFPFSSPAKGPQDTHFAYQKFKTVTNPLLNTQPLQNLHGIP